MRESDWEEVDDYLEKVRVQSPAYKAGWVLDYKWHIYRKPAWNTLMTITIQVVIPSLSCRSEIVER
jgi:hypothetical protein